jgi:hypothetical protein
VPLLPFGGVPGVPTRGTYATGTTVVETDQVAGDTTPRFSRDASGKLQWGPGNAALDTNFYRSALNMLKSDGALTLGGEKLVILGADGNLDSCILAANLVTRSGAATAASVGSKGPAGQSGVAFQGGESGSNLYRVSSGTLKTDGSFQLGTGATGGKLSTSRGIASGALPTVTFTSTTGAQVDTTSDRFVSVPITYTLLASTCKVELSPDNVTYSTIVTKSPGVAGDVDTIDLYVPAAWYVKLTTTNATIGAAAYW